MKPSELIKYGILAGGAWYLWSHYGYMFTGGAAPVDPTTSNTPATTSPTPNPQAPTTRALMVAYVASNPSFSANGLASFDQWSWVYQQVRGSAGPAIEDVFGADADRARLITLDEYWSGLSSHGIGKLINLPAFFNRGF